MTTHAATQRWRDALVGAMIPSPAPDLPGADQLDLDGFWARFQHAAPWHLRLGFWAAVLVLGGLLPLFLFRRRSVLALDADARDALLRRGQHMPGVGPLVDILKVVACLGYFADPGIIAAAKERR